MKEYNIYIDESGDEGIKRGSKFFILTAILIEKEKDAKIEKEIHLLKAKINENKRKKDELHWIALRSEEKKQKILATINKMDITIINIVIDTNKMQFISSAHLYPHFTAYLYERISWFIRDHHALVSSRSNLIKKDLIDFLKNHSHFRIDYKRIKEIKIIPNEQKNNLQLADCCCSALGQALRNNDKKHRIYISFLYKKYYTYKHKYLGYGLKYVPNTRNYAPEFKDLIHYLNTRKE